MQKLNRVAIALGSNLGNRLGFLQLAACKLRHLAASGEPFLASSVYETTPVDCPPDAQSFLNAVVEFSTAETPEVLLSRLQGMEQFLGRSAIREKNASRTLDLDILYYGTTIQNNAELSLPHPRWAERLFVLEPLAEIVPDCILPGTNKSVALLLKEHLAAHTERSHMLDTPLIAPKFARKFQAEFLSLKKGKQGIAVLTAYDYPSARLLDESDIDIILVGDSLGMVVLGYPDTTTVTIEDIVHHLKAVRRGVVRAMVVADLPANTYPTPELALASANRLMDAGADAVKLEGGRNVESQIAYLTAHGIPVMAHIGMLPQHVLEEGGYKIKGRTEEEINRLVLDAQSVEKAGAFSVVLEIVQAVAADRVSQSIHIPTIGIGSGKYCDGQVLVTHDLVGFFPWFTPKFVQPKGDMAREFRKAVDQFVRDIKG